MAHAPPQSKKRARRWPVALALLVVVTTLAAHSRWRLNIMPPDPAAAALVEWALAGGATLPGAVVGRACRTCPRGVFASKDLQTGDRILSVPFSLALPVSTRPDAANLSLSECARELLIRMHTDPSVNNTWGTYWASMPGINDMLGTDLFTPEQLTLLQHPGLAAQVRAAQSFVESVFDGSFNNGTYPPLSATLPGVTLEALKHTLALIKTRAFGAYADAHVSFTGPYMLPVVDLLNHKEDANTQKVVHQGTFNMIASRPIAKGAEIFNQYSPNEIHRADKALFAYGFVSPQDRPLLCASDLPEGFDFKSPTDSLYEDPTKGFMTLAEYNRLAAALAAAPTTEEEDDRLLRSGIYTDWRDREIIKFRIMRKRALRQALEKLGAALQAGQQGKAEL